MYQSSIRETPSQELPVILQLLGKFKEKGLIGDAVMQEALKELEDHERNRKQLIQLKNSQQEDKSDDATFRSCTAVKVRGPAAPSGQAFKKTSSESLDSAVIPVIYEHDKDLLIQMSLKDTKIKELTNRLSMLASQRLQDGNPDIADLSDPYRPTKLAEMFSQLYDDEWSDAFETMKSRKNEVEIIQCLLEVVKRGWSFCQKLAEDQMSQLTQCMEEQILLPKYRDEDGELFQPSMPPKLDDDANTMMTMGLRYARLYQKTAAIASVKSVIVLFRHYELPGLFSGFGNNLPVPIDIYTDKCITILWLMAVQDPPLSLHWQNTDSDVQTDYFSFYDKKGKKVKQSVWPAVFLHKDGPIMTKGYVLPE